MLNPSFKPRDRTWFENELGAPHNPEIVCLDDVADLWIETGSGDAVEVG